ncbi:hypothetical protein RB620_12225 [Paenibacillus sp. LHD-117]|uniref:hypothetical protein n=1 Tax=Paenibacillus sp. LHD-117 TaxID=3071412 RepID=UPI0027E05F33|nr:hypothetical protein [Paenibacillus sp. LHD-117]MDQ6420203.1 hypothetical protein [Paenibacillus sp. LHD-117]
MIKHYVYYETDGDTGLELPVWLIAEGISGADWNDVLDLRLEAPFEARSVDELDPDAMMLAVPDHAYVRRRDASGTIGIHLSSLRDYVSKIATVSDHSFSHRDVDRLLLRISDIEDALQYEVRSVLARRDVR